MTALSRSVPEPRARRGRLSLNAVSALVVVAAIAGLLLGGFAGGGDPPAPRAAHVSAPATAHDGLRLRLPSGWSRGDVAAVPGFHHPLGLHNADEGLRATVARLPATSATLLPAAYLETLERAPAPPVLVPLAAGRQAWRYRFPGRDGSMTIFFAAPTTAGVATVACTSPLGGSVPNGCSALAAAVTVPGSSPLEPGATAAFYSRLPGIVSGLNTARAKGVADLAAAPHARDQALAADGLGRAHTTAGAALAPLTRKGDGVPAATIGALTAAGSAYGALATAARARRPRPYADARREVAGAETDLRRAMAKAAAGVSAASRQPSTSAAAEKPAAAARPAKARPPASGGRGTDLTLAILGFVGVIAIFFAVRGIRFALRA